MLRRENEKKNKQIRFGVLCGTIVIIPAEAKEALEQEIGTSGKVTFSRIGNLPETDYLKVTAVGNAHFLTGAVTNVFSKGYMQVLVGTKIAAWGGMGFSLHQFPDPCKLCRFIYVK